MKSWFGSDGVFTPSKQKHADLKAFVVGLGWDKNVTPLCECVRINQISTYVFF